MESRRAAESAPASQSYGVADTNASQDLVHETQMSVSQRLSR